MKRKKGYLRLMLCSTLIFGTTLLSACSGRQEGQAFDRPTREEVPVENVSLSLWVPEEEIEMVEQLVKNFDAYHREYSIEYEISGIDLADSVTMVREPEGDVADIFYVPSGGVPSLAKEGKLLAFSGEDLNKLSVDLPESALEAVSVDENLYAVPFSPNSFFMYYNTDFYSEEEVKSLDTMMAKDFGAGKYNFTTNLSDSWYLEMFFLGSGSTLFGEDGTDPTDCTFNSAAGVAAANYVLDLVHNPRYLDDSNGGYDEFLAGNVGAYTTGAWAAPDLKEALGDKLSAAALPTVNIGGAEARLSNFIDFKTIAVSNATSNPEVAQKLAVYLGNRDSSLRRYEKFGDIPVLKNLANDESIKNDYAALALNNQANYSTNQPNIPQMDSYWEPMANFGTDILSGAVDSGNVQDKLNALVAQIVTPADATDDGSAE